MKEIKLTQGKSAIVPDEVAEFLNQFKWYANKKGNTYYAVRNAKKHERINGKPGLIGMHRVIWEKMIGPIPKGYEIDHENHNGQYNSIENLKCVPHKDNMKNRSF